MHIIISLNVFRSWSGCALFLFGWFSLSLYFFQSNGKMNYLIKKENQMDSSKRRLIKAYNLTFTFFQNFTYVEEFS